MLRSLFSIGMISFGILVGGQLAVPSLAVSAELAEIQDRGYLIVAVKESWYPLGFRSDAGELVGFEIDIARRLAEALLGDPDAIVFEPVANVDRVNAVVDGEVDIAIATVTVTPQRQRIATFSTPYYLDGTGFITRQSNVQTLESLSRSSIALLDNSSTVAHVRYVLPGATLVPIDTYQDALNLLETGEVDAFAGDATVITGWSQQDSRYRVLADIISAEPLAVVMPKGTQYGPLRRQINMAIEDWYTDGWLQDRANFWGLP